LKNKENLEMSGILTAVGDVTKCQGNVREVSAKTSCRGKVAKNCLL